MSSSSERSFSRFTLLTFLILVGSLSFWSRSSRVKRALEADKATPATITNEPLVDTHMTGGTLLTEVLPNLQAVPSTLVKSKKPVGTPSSSKPSAEIEVPDEGAEDALVAQPVLAPYGEAFRFVSNNSYRNAVYKNEVDLPTPESIPPLTKPSTAYENYSLGYVDAPNPSNVAPGGFLQTQERPTRKKQTVLKNWEVVQFVPGKTDDGKTITVPANIEKYLLGPDYSLTDQSADHALSFGHGGKLTLRYTGETPLLDREGYDFIIYENPFIDPATGKMVHEFARVRVAAKSWGGRFKEFPCQPTTQQVRYCAGFRSRSEGGDLFDLREIGAPDLDLLEIEDIGTNANYRIGTEGFDLDAVKAR